jgi:hypothetical protein
MINIPVSKSSEQVGKLNIHTLTKDQYSKQFVSDDTQYLCILPFTRTSDDRIKSIYALESTHLFNGENQVVAIVDEFNQDLDTNLFSGINRALIEEVGIDPEANGITIKDFFLLGEFNHSFPVEASVVCYGIDLTGKPSLDFTRNLSKDKFTDSKVVEVGFHRVVNGDIKDSAILAASFLLVSNFN